MPVTVKDANVQKKGIIQDKKQEKQNYLPLLKIQPAGERML